MLVFLKKTLFLNYKIRNLVSGLLLTKTFSYNCKIYNYSDLNSKH